MKELTEEQIEKFRDEINYNLDDIEIEHARVIEKMRDEANNLDQICEIFIKLSWDVMAFCRLCRKVLNIHTKHDMAVWGYICVEYSVSYERCEQFDT